MLADAKAIVERLEAWESMDCLLQGDVLGLTHDCRDPA